MMSKDSSSHYRRPNRPGRIIGKRINSNSNNENENGSDCVSSNVSSGWDNKRNSSFSSRLLQHGNWVDNSLDAATKAKKRMIMNEYRRNFSIDRINQNFSEEADHLLKLQQLLAIKQKRMAFTVVEKYSALSIQLCFRCYISRKRLFIKKTLRYLNDWLWGVYQRRKRYRARQKIYSTVLYWYRHKCFVTMLIKVRKARQIQANVRRALTSYKFKQYRDYMRDVRTIVAHVFLFASSRAVRIILNERDKLLENCKRVIRNAVIKYRCRKRRNILKGPYGKFIFYFLEQKSMQCILTDFKAKPLVNKDEIRHLSVADVAKAITAAKKKKENEEEEIARDIILYVKHKVEEKAASKGDSVANNVTIDKTKILVATRRRMSLRKSVSPAIIVQSLGRPIELPNGLSVQLPASWPSLFRMSSMYEAACMIIDLLEVALENQSLVDDEIPKQIIEMNTPKPPVQSKGNQKPSRPSRGPTSRQSMTKEPATDEQSNNVIYTLKVNNGGANRQVTATSRPVNPRPSQKSIRY